jgi:hypothetical protein
MVGSGFEVRGWSRGRVSSSVELQGFRVVRGVGRSRKRLAKKKTPRESALYEFEL